MTKLANTLALALVPSSLASAYHVAGRPTLHSSAMHGAALKHRSLAAKPASVSMMAATVGPAVDMASINGDDDLATQEKTLAMAMSLELSGGATGVVSQKGNFVGAFASAWGALGVMYILASPIKRLLPIALQPFASPGDLSTLGWACYAAWVAFMGYTEGYKAFQLKFCPMVVNRAMTLNCDPSARPKGYWLHALLAPFYSMGLFHATKKRKIVSWAFIFGIGTIVALVKRLPYPWRSVIDGGVVLGLSWGATSVIAFYLRAVLFGKPPAADACMPGV
eukprot:CAMPEP_0119470952 /NCGR_PEP_ID=MMETSP1344-20130328/3632_1 /TAXON_ID=236787 /ORGANISM="Florenciella parvula, Strain CCMP2471" /LENGTH=278 /DNA_ID=CAMNT_0007503687 /DNA_START=63 /DNA_END=899 /DNA_ORIENTATION=-